MNEEPSESFGNLLRDFRLAAGLSQEVLAERARMSLGGISMLERGARRSPRRETIALLADGLHLRSEERARLEAAAKRAAQPRRRRASAREVRSSHNLPRELTSFVGRTEEIAEIAALLETRRIVTLVGAGGVGKTRTALQVARKVPAGTSESVWFVDLTTLHEASTSVAAAIARTLGIEEKPNRATIEILISYVAGKSILLVLDNCERVLSDVANVVREIVRAEGTVRILATSREPLRVQGEQIYRLPSLPVSESVELFAQRAGEADHRFKITDDNRSVVAQICERLDGIPLAIELAAARSGVLPLRSLCEKLDRRFAMLAGDNPEVSPRQRTMRALIDWSYDLLSERERDIFEELSVFAGGCTLEAAASVCRESGVDEADVFETLVSLVDKSLVTAVGPVEPRYVMLESMREYAREKLVQRGAWNQTAHRHALAYYEIASQLEERLFDRPCPAEFDVEIENWRAALDWTLHAEGDPELGTRLAGVLRPVWLRLSPGEGRYWLRSAFERVNDRTPLPVLARLEYSEAKLSQRLAEPQRAFDFGMRALESFRLVADARRILQAQAVVGVALLGLGRIDEAEPLFVEVLDAAKRGGARYVEAASLQSLGLIHSFRRQFDESQRYFFEAMVIYREVGDSSDFGVSASNLAEAKFRAGDVAGAVQLAEQAIDAFGGIEHARPLTFTNLAAYLVAVSRYDEARTRALEGLDVARRRKVPVAISWSLQNLAAIAVLRPPQEALVSRSLSDAVRVLGFVNSQLAALGVVRDYTEQQEYDRVIASLHATNGRDVAMLLEAGAILTEGQAVALALSLS